MPELRKSKPKDKPSKIVQFQVVHGDGIFVLDDAGDLMLASFGGGSYLREWRMIARTSKKAPEEMDDTEYLAFIEQPRWRPSATPSPDTSHYDSVRRARKKR